ncbi:MAG TPA: acetate/propionate family kinase [Planctomycetaceae bacterium]|nr:acetate/propionate family kinase [Planctomycetaceae bacterium]
MKVLVANLGSTSFKYRLFAFPAEEQLARGSIDRIGQAQSVSCVEIGKRREEVTLAVPDHAAAVGICLAQLMHPEWGCIESASEVAAIGFKAVFAGRLSGVRIVDELLLATMEKFSEIAPAHNPMYAKAMRQLRSAFPEIPLVAALETAFHETIPDAHRFYAVPYEWKTDYEVCRWGYHGASHRFLSGRMAQLLGRNDLKLVTCHLGGSNSLCAVKDGASLANSLGMSPQSGLPHNNRVGDFDPFALPVLMRATGKTLDQLLQELSNKSGLLGLSGLSQDVRDLEQAADQGHARARLALDVFIASIRQYLGAYLAILGGADAIVFSGGIGENSKLVRSGVCAGMDWAGIVLDDELNRGAKGEARISADRSRTQVWVVPTNEEIVVARQTAQALEGS